jgi:hypothetical protein
MSLFKPMFYALVYAYRYCLGYLGDVFVILQVLAVVEVRQEQTFYQYGWAWCRPKYIEVGSLCHQRRLQRSKLSVRTSLFQCAQDTLAESVSF